MVGRDGRKYIIEATDKGVDTAFKVVDEQTREVVDAGWLVISKNGILRIERIK